MATYPNLPGGFMYDLGRDGSLVTIKDANGTTQKTLTEGELDSLSIWKTGYKFTAGGSNLSNWRMVALFPQDRTITGVAASTFNQYGGTAVIEYSLDTVDGHQGTWVQIATYNSTAQSSGAALRGRIWLVNIVNAKALRVRATYDYPNYYETFVVWGTTATYGLTPWHPTLDQPLSNDTGSLDRGDIFINAAPVTQTFRIKNASTTHNATNVVVSTDATGDIGKLDDETLFSLDNTTFQSTQTIPTIAMGAISPAIYMKRPTPSDPAGTTRIATVKAVAGSWDV